MASYAAVGRAFDDLAPRYDGLVESNPLHAYLRGRSVAWLDEAFQPGMRVLEIGCGVGHEAVHLARRGVHVVATDISLRMVEATRTRVNAEGLERFVRVEQCAAGNVDKVFAPESFEGAYASLGALNCEPALEPAIRQVAACLCPTGSFLASVVSRPSLPETAIASARLRFRKAFRRMGRTVRVDLYGLDTVEARAYSEGEVLRALDGPFAIEHLEGWLVALPPPYAGAAWERLRPFHAPLESLEARIRAVWPFRGWGDHLHVWARRR